MSERRTIVLSLIERGWQAARECSLDTRQQGIDFVHLIKGRLNRAIRALIAPRPNVQIVIIPRSLFWPWAWALLIGSSVGGRLRSVLVDNERSYRRLHGWSRMACVNLIIVRQGSGGYELWSGPQRLSPAAWREALEGHANCPHLR